jgi:hypothetical protein
LLPVNVDRSILAMSVGDLHEAFRTGVGPETSTGLIVVVVVVVLVVVELDVDVELDVVDELDVVVVRSGQLSTEKRRVRVEVSVRVRSEVHEFAGP